MAKKQSITEDTARIIAQHLFGKKPKKIVQLEGGLSNFVYEVTMPDGDYVIRICDVPGKINYYQKEQWAVCKAREKKVPVPEILEVGNEIVPFPYMVTKKIEGMSAENHPERLKILQELGSYAATINTIPTTGFGHVYDWSSNTLSKNDTWKEYLEKELDIPGRLRVFDEQNIFKKLKMKKLKSTLKKLESLHGKPMLTHGDLRLKNVLLDKDGKIQAILDWENSSSNMAPYWELSVALHDISIDEKEKFLEGYGIKWKDYLKMVPLIKALNIINYAPVVYLMAQKKNKEELEKLKLRLNGAFDLYSL